MTRARHRGLWRGLVGAWYPMLGVTGATLIDCGPYRGDGTTSNTTWQTGALSFNGSTAIVNMGDTNQARIAAGAITIAAVCTPTGYGGGNFGRIYSREAASNGLNVFTQATNSCVGFAFAGATVTSQTNSLALNTRTTVIVTQYGTAVTFYINGTIAGTATGGTSASTGAGAAYIGNRAGLARGFVGTIECVLLWSRSLSQAECNIVYADPFAPLRCRDMPVFDAGSSLRRKLLTGSD